MRLPSSKIVLLIALVYLNLPVSGQRFDSLLNLLDTKYPQEKIYLHFDRPVYSPGETIWFKAYLFTGTFPSTISKTIYAELLDDQGKVLQRRTAPVMLSGAAAAFDLPSNLQSATVYVRAYTRWMLNFDSSFLFIRSFPIAKGGKSSGLPSTPPAAFLQFFPEGGDMVTGLPSKVAFKATDARGLPVNVKGDIVTNSGKTVISFASIHDGMGYFIFQPVQGEQYKAVWKDQAGKPHETALPVVLPDGLAIRVNNLGERINFVVQKSAEAKFSDIHIVAHLQQQLLYRAKANLSNRTTAAGTIPLQGIPAGVIQITVFNEKDQPLAERLVFVNQDDYYFITDLNAASKNMTKRAKNVIQIDVPDTIACNLSVSVTDAALNPPSKHEDDIFSHTLLTSDIRGYVHQPAYYFSGADSSASYLDLVMLTNGWRRFRWEEVVAGRWPDIRHLPENYLSISGKVSGLNKSALVQRELIGMLETKNGGRNFLNIPVNPDGTFELVNAVFFDTARLFYQFNNDKDKLLTSRGIFEFRNTLFNESLQIKPEIVVPFRPDSMLLVKNASVSRRRQDQEDARRKVETLATVEVKAKQKSKEEKFNDQYAKGMFSGDGRIFVMEDDPRSLTAMNVFQYLQGQVAGLQITPGAMGPTLSWRGGVPGLYLDEMQMDAEALNNIPMSDVAMIKVFNPPFLGAFGGGSGAIAVYTKRGSSAGESTKGLDFAKIPGYSPVKEFYSPDYSKYDQSSDEADYRKTIYWNPFVLTDKQNRRILLTFYNNDITNRIRVVVEGINTEGKLTRIEKIFE
ncbi:MAG TPA: hypothetical protein VGD17_14895 [Chitinophagaceae bacterium]